MAEVLSGRHGGLRTLAGLVWLSECELGRSYCHVVFCPDAALRKNCVQCTTASFEELKEATRFRERWRFRTREVSRTLPVRCVAEVAGLGTLSPLGGHSRDSPEEQDVSHSVAGFGRAADFEKVSTQYSVWLDSQVLRTRRTYMRASSPKALEVEEGVVAIRRLPAAWGNPSRWHTIIEGNFKFTEVIHIKEGRAALVGLRRPVREQLGTVTFF